jgi:uncharacterized protein with ACT and thioredoxin-like domain
MATLYQTAGSIGTAKHPWAMAAGRASLASIGRMRGERAAVATAAGLGQYTHRVRDALARPATLGPDVFFLLLAGAVIGGTITAGREVAGPARGSDTCSGTCGIEYGM